MIDVRSASALLDFGTRIGKGQRSQEQLEGAVAIHNILANRNVAYLADEVGMGKTYVALGALALFRHYQPNFRALIIAPRENIQNKWMKEMRNFVTHNVRFPDLRGSRHRSDDCRETTRYMCGRAIKPVRPAGGTKLHWSFLIRHLSFVISGCCGPGLRSQTTRALLPHE